MMVPGKSQLRYAALLAMLIASSPSARGQSSKALTAATCRTCSESEMAEYAIVASYSHGITGKDVLGHNSGYGAARDATGRATWWSNSPTKETICGQLQRFNHHVDGDWSFNVLPDDGTSGKALLDAAIATGSNYKKCNGGTAHCVHGEVNMDQRFPTDDFFKLVYDINESSFYAARTDLIGEKLCLYGTWLKDKADDHGERPEIHPAEIIWWGPSTARAIGGATHRTYHVMLLQDDTERFDAFADFYLPSGMSRPWSMPPRRSQVRLWFSVDLNSAIRPSRQATVLSYRVSERHARNVITQYDGNSNRDEGPGAEHTVTYEGFPVVRATEVGPDHNLGVRFEGLCRAPRTNRLFGRVVLDSKYGWDNDGREGFHVLDIVRSEAPVVTAGPIRLDSAMLSMLSQIREAAQNLVPSYDERPSRFHILKDFYPSDVRRVGNALVADVASTPEDSASLGRRIRSARFLPANAGGTVSTPAFRRGGNPPILLRDVPITRGGVVLIEFEDGTVLNYQVPRLGIGRVHVQRAAEGIHVVPQQWRAFVAASEASNVRTIRNDRLIQPDAWTVEAAFQYAAIDEDGLPEEQVGISRYLNSIVAAADSGARQTARFTELFRSGRPFSVQWTFRGTNTSKRTVTAVRHGRDRATDAIVIDTLGVRGRRLLLRVHFPNSSDIHRLDATALVTDEFGITGSLPFTVWSHALAPAEGTSPIDIVTQLTGADKDALTIETAAVAPASVRNLQSIIFARAARDAAVESLRDGYIFPEELRSLSNIAARYGASRN